MFDWSLLLFLFVLLVNFGVGVWAKTERIYRANWKASGWLFPKGDRWISGAWECWVTDEDTMF